MILLANPKRGHRRREAGRSTAERAGHRGSGPRRGSARSPARCSTSVTPDDAYCNTDGQSTPFLASLGRIIANPPGAVDVSAQLASTAAPQTPTVMGESTVAQSSSSSPLLDSLSSPGDWRNADLSAVLGAATRLSESVASLDAGGPTSTTSAANIARITQQARLVSETLTPVSQASEWIDSNPGARQTFSSLPWGRRSPRPPVFSTRLGRSTFRRCSRPRSR